MSIVNKEKYICIRNYFGRLFSCAILMKLQHIYSSDIVYSQMFLFTIATKFCAISRTIYKLL